MFHLGLPGSPVGLPGSSEVPKSCRTLEAVCPREQTLRCAERREAVRSVAKRRGAAWGIASRRQGSASAERWRASISGASAERWRINQRSARGALARINQRSQRGALVIFQRSQRAALDWRSASISGASAQHWRINQRSQRAALPEPTLMMRGTFGMPDGAGRSQRAALAELIIQRSQRAAPSEPTLMMRGTFVMPGGARLDTSISADWMLHEEWQNLPTQTLTALRDYINRFAHVYILCVSADVQKKHSLNVGMMKMEELRQAFILYSDWVIGRSRIGGADVGQEQEENTLVGLRM